MFWVYDPAEQNEWGLPVVTAKNVAWSDERGEGRMDFMLYRNDWVFSGPPEEAAGELDDDDDDDDFD